MRAAAVVAAVLVFLTLAFWGVGLAVGFDADCPLGPKGVEGRTADPSGLDTKLSLWPPGRSCDYGGRTGVDVAQPLGWIDAAILGSAGLAAVILLLGLISTVRYRWLRPQQ